MEKNKKSSKLALEPKGESGGVKCKRKKMKKIPKHNSNKRQLHKCTNRCALHLYRNKNNSNNNNNNKQEKSCRYLSAHYLILGKHSRAFRKHRNPTANRDENPVVFEIEKMNRKEKKKEERKKCSVLLCNPFEPEAIGPTLPLSVSLPATQSSREIEQF